MWYNWPVFPFLAPSSSSSAILPQYQQRIKERPCNFQTLTFPLAYRNRERVFQCRSLFSPCTDLMHCSCGEWSAGWIVRWRCSHIYRRTQEIEMYLHMHTRHVKGSVCGALEQSLIQGCGGRTEGQGFIEFIGIEWLHNVNYTHPKLSHFRRAFTLNSKQRTYERVTVFGCGRRHPERDCWCKTFLFVAWGGVCLVPPGGQGENRSVTNITKSDCSSNSWFWYTQTVCVILTRHLCEVIN